MTQSHKSDYAKALDRAIAQECAILGKGKLTRDVSFLLAGEQFYVVNASGKNWACYLVVVRGLHLVCNCPARGYCKHRAIVRHRIESDAIVASLAVQIAAQDAARDAAIFHRGDGGPRLFRWIV